MIRPELALAASARDWSDRLHRLVLDHGGATIKGRVMSADQAVAGSFDAFLIDDICSFLTPRLVSDLRAQGKAVIGVFDPGDGSDAKRRLLEAGVSDVIEADATAEEFLEFSASSVSHLGSSRPTETEITEPVSGMRIAVTGPPGGVGSTEVACGLALELASIRPTVLVDCNQAWPGVAQRLALPVHPNLLTAVDLALHQPDRLSGATHRMGELDIVSGLANPSPSRLTRSELRSVVGALTATHHFVVADVGPVGPGLEDFPLREVGAILVIGAAGPVGLTRLIRAYQEIRDVVGESSQIALVVNRVGRSPRQRAETLDTLGRSLGEVPVALVPEDPKLARWSWDGVPAGKGVYRRAVRRLARVVAGGTS